MKQDIYDGELASYGGRRYKIGDTVRIRNGETNDRFLVVDYDLTDERQYFIASSSLKKMDQELFVHENRIYKS